MAEEKKYLYINTIGCQMNVYDSERMITGLKKQGYEETPFIENAHLIIMNTCAIREKAEQKVFSFLGRLSKLKRKNPEVIISVGGCVAQQEGREILRRVPSTDIVFGTHAIDRLPELVKRVEKKRCRVIDIQMSENPDEIQTQPSFSGKPRISRFVTIMQGCDNFCTYCVVPYVRGREKSRNPENIIDEIRRYVGMGTREVTLLGQNVNSYGKKELHCSFPELLAGINEIEGLLRIRFTTSHPKDLSSDLMAAFRNLEKLCGHIHLPVQSGSNKILKGMNRKYTREEYLEKVQRLRKLSPDIAVTSDFIVGFPGETGADFNRTLDLIKSIQYDSAFAFIYSDRPNAPAKRLKGKISEQEKKDRLQALLELQETITRDKNAALVGSTQSVLVDGFSKKQISGGNHSDVSTFASDPETDSGRSPQWTGRTVSNRIVNFISNDESLCGYTDLSGLEMNIRIEKAYAHSLWGKPERKDPFTTDRKGEKTYAA